MDLILSRYHDVNYILKMKPSKATKLITHAIQERYKDRMFDVWVHEAQTNDIARMFSSEVEDFPSFNEYLEKIKERTSTKTLLSETEKEEIRKRSAEISARLRGE